MCIRDSVYNAADAQIIDGKSPVPKVFGGFGTTVSYKNFDVSAEFTYKFGGYTLNYAVSYTHLDVYKRQGPSIPVTVLGLDGAPTAGDKFKVYEDEREAKSIANKREQLQREQTIRTKKHLTLDELGRRIALGDFKELNIILKGDVDGSVEALSDQLQRLSTEEISVNIIHKGCLLYTSRCV